MISRWGKAVMCYLGKLGRELMTRDGGARMALPMPLKRVVDASRGRLFYNGMMPCCPAWLRIVRIQPATSCLSCKKTAGCTETYIIGR